jgi:methyl-accepting chemotaxis protein
MDPVKKSIYLSIGALLALMGLLGTHSLWNVSRMSSATARVVASDAVASQAQAFGFSFLSAEQTFRQATALIDAVSTDENRAAFLAQCAALRAEAKKLETAVAGDLLLAARNLKAEVDNWAGLTAKHLGVEEVTALPAYHLIDEARSRVSNTVDALVKRSSAEASAANEASLAANRSAFLWTVVELVLAVALGLFLGCHSLNRLRLHLGADVSAVGHITNAVARGDLSVRIPTRNVPEGSVMASTARMQQSLVRTVSRVRDISHGLVTEQAAALERTSAIMADFGATVQRNAESAAQAGQLTEEARSMAHRGGEVVKRVIQTMGDIQDGSKQISDITGIINGIAFQTNILALNAAVEAARAGDKGLGFAVVASEVRSLAKRSADAAQEIERLISSNVGHVQTGNNLVKQAGESMLEIVSSIERVTQVMATIREKNANSEATGSQLGETAQQSAVLVDQSAAAAESLRRQSEELMEAVSFFKLAASPAPARSTRSSMDQPPRAKQPRSVAAVTY